VVEVLEAMGGLLRPEDEEEAERQLLAQAQAPANGQPPPQQLFRTTAMFSATMPTEVEHIARGYLRHPVVVKIGDEDTGKNKRIEQRVQFIAEGQKRSHLVDELRRLSSSEKAIVFVNSKKQGDTVGRHLDSVGLRAGVLHGGHSQDQCEETLDLFRNGALRVLVATLTSRAAAWTSLTSRTWLTSTRPQLL
jgi:ATP-dependent RNA helicase DDX23/PRP28